MFVGKFYYSIWTDGIKRMQERFPGSTRFVNFLVMFLMTISFGGFSMFIYALIARLIGLPLLSLHLQSAFWNNILSVLTFFMLPWFLIHYYFVFWKDKYEEFLPKYRYRNGQLFTNYFIIIVLSPLVIMVVAVIIAKITE